MTKKTNPGNGTSTRRLQMDARGSKFTMLLSKDERTQLYELAVADGVPASVYLRTLIRTVHRDTIASPNGAGESKKRARK